MQATTEPTNINQEHWFERPSWNWWYGCGMLPFCFYIFDPPLHSECCVCEKERENKSETTSEMVTWAMILMPKQIWTFFFLLLLHYFWSPIVEVWEKRRLSVHVVQTIHFSAHNAHALNRTRRIACEIPPINTHTHTCLCDCTKPNFAGKTKQVDQWICIRGQRN